MLHVSSKWKCCFRFTANKTLRAGARLLCTESLRLEKTFKMESNYFGQLYPHKVVYYMKEWTLMEITICTR